jgi:hypothetical protein
MGGNGAAVEGLEDPMPFSVAHTMGFGKKEILYSIKFLVIYDPCFYFIASLPFDRPQRPRGPSPHAPCSKGNV